MNDSGDTFTKESKVPVGIFVSRASHFASKTDHLCSSKSVMNTESKNLNLIIKIFLRK